MPPTFQFALIWGQWLFGVRIRKRMDAECWYRTRVISIHAGPLTWFINYRIE